MASEWYNQTCFTISPILDLWNLDIIHSIIHQIVYLVTSTQLRSYLSLHIVQTRHSMLVYVETSRSLNWSWVKNVDSDPHTEHWSRLTHYACPSWIRYNISATNNVWVELINHRQIQTPPYHQYQMHPSTRWMRSGSSHWCHWCHWCRDSVVPSTIQTKVFAVWQYVCNDLFAANFEYEYVRMNWDCIWCSMCTTRYCTICLQWCGAR